jgi:hypothetical protein
MMLTLDKCTRVAASQVHKQLMSKGMTTSDLERWQSLLSPPSDYPWPQDLKNLNLRKQTGRERHADAFEDLLDRFSIGPDQASGRFVGARMIHAAAASGFVHIVRLLVLRGADVCVKDSHGNTAVVEALQRGHVEIVQYLTSVGVEAVKKQMQMATKTGYTVLALAVNECRTWYIRRPFHGRINVLCSHSLHLRIIHIYVHIYIYVYIHTLL